MKKQRHVAWALILFTWMLLIGCSYQADVVHHVNQEVEKKETKKSKQKHLPSGFVYLLEIDPTIQIDMRYVTHHNFMGRPIIGYRKPVIILTRKAAEALKRVQERVRKDGYSLVVYDAYRPQKAVDHFVRWSQDLNDQMMKKWFYPRVNKEDLFPLGYIAEKSGHSRGSTVDLTLIRWGKEVQPICFKRRTMVDGKTVLPFLDDGTIDMGTSFDLFDSASHSKSQLIGSKQQKRRNYLRKVMEECGFKSYAEEWWHFTLKNEPFPNTYFDFDVR